MFKSQRVLFIINKIIFFTYPTNDKNNNVISFDHDPIINVTTQFLNLNLNS